MYWCWWGEIRFWLNWSHCPCAFCFTLHCSINESFQLLYLGKSCSCTMEVWHSFRLQLINVFYKKAKKTHQPVASYADILWACHVISPPPPKNVCWTQGNILFPLFARILDFASKIGWRSCENYLEPIGGSFYCVINKLNRLASASTVSR